MENALAIADAAGPTWAHRARQAARQLSGLRETDDASALALLRDTRAVFDSLGEAVTEVTSTQIVAELNKMEDRPWPDQRHGKGITPAWFASRMKEFGVVPGGPYWFVVNGERKQLRGYRRAAFADAWNRYLEGSQTVTCNNVNNDGPNVPFQGVTDDHERYTLKTAISPITTVSCDGVTASPPEAGNDAASEHPTPSRRESSREQARI